MFEQPLKTFKDPVFCDECCRPQNQYAHQYNTALNLFQSAINKGKFLRLLKKVLRRKPSLYDLNQIKPQLHVHGSSYAGLKVVRIANIIGSEGKVSDFDMGFHPLPSVSRERWLGVAMAFLSRLSLPAIQLIQVGDAYFVRDGHHRISVARAMGQIAIDAEVVIWNAAPPFPWQSEAATKEMQSWKRIDQSA